MGFALCVDCACVGSSRSLDSSLLSAHQICSLQGLTRGTLYLGSLELL
uniref:Uncharacterized protein n=1 Tax=Arundo donax TaxID=35708 RepID=A0A0A9H009_ARUDO